jgi:hypothetical protein
MKRCLASIGAVVLFTAIILASCILRRVDLRTGLLLKPNLLHGEIREGMVPVKAIARTDYFFTGKWFDFIPGNNVHDLLLFPVKPSEMASMEVAITTFYPWYPAFFGASPFFAPISADCVDAFDKTVIDAGGYDNFSTSVKCMIVGNGKFSKMPKSYELWYFPLD